MASSGLTDDAIAIIRRILGSSDLMNSLLNQESSGSASK